jgi:hypothetical protein
MQKSIRSYSVLLFCWLPNYVHLESTPFQKIKTIGLKFYFKFYFFFDKSMYYIKKRKGAQPLVHWEYTKGTRKRERKRRENLQS